MRFRMGFVVALAILGALAVPASGGAQYRSSVELVRVVVTAFDTRGEPVEDLGVEDIQVFEDDIERPLKLMVPSGDGLDVWIVVDNSGSVRGYRLAIVEALAELARRLPPATCARILLAADRIRPQPWMPVARLASASVFSVATEPGSRILDALALALRPSSHPHAGCTHEREVVEGRMTVVVLLSDLKDQASETSVIALRRLIDAHPTQLHVLVFGRAPLISRRAFETLASRSGGKLSILRVKGDLWDATRRIAATTRAGYLIGFEPPMDREPEAERALRIETSRSGVILTHKPSYRR